MFLCVSSSITNNDLWWVFVWHHNSWNWQTTSVRVWIISLQWFPGHTRVKKWSLFVRMGLNWHSLWRFVHILMTEWVFPSCFLKWICNCNRLLVILHQYFLACFDLIILEVGCWFIQFNRVVDLRWVKHSVGVLCFVSSWGSVDISRFWSWFLPSSIWSFHWVLILNFQIFITNF